MSSAIREPACSASACCPASTPIQAALKMLPNVDVIVAGEVREWESVEYARDKVFAGEKKGADSRRPRRVRRARHGGLRELAEDVRPRSADPAYPRRRSVLEASLMTAGDVVDRIKKNLGVPWRDTTYRDTFKFGGPDTEVTGIATTVFCSFEVVQRASAAGLQHDHPARSHLLERSRRRDDRQRRSALQDEGRLHAEEQHRRLPHSRPHACAAARLHLRRFRARARSRRQVRDGAELAPVRRSRDHAGSSGRRCEKRERRARAQSRWRSQRQGQPHPARRRLRDACGQQRGSRRGHQRRAAGDRRHARQSGIRARRRHARHQ